MPVVLAALAALALGFAQGGAADSRALALPSDTISVERRGPPLIQVEPGRTAAVPFLVQNHGSSPVDLTFRARVPDGWRIHGGEQPRRLEPGGTHLRVVSVSPPSQTPARTASVHLEILPRDRATSDRPSRVWVGDSVEVALPRRPEISLTPLASRDVAVAGDKYGAAFLLRNTGNVPVELELTARSGGGYRTRLAPNHVRLGPSEQVYLRADVWTTPGIERARREVLSVRARAPLPDDLDTQASVGVDLLPALADAEGDRFHRIPAEVHMSTSPGSGDVPPISVAAAGRIFDDRDGEIELLARGPHVDRSTTGKRDEYRLRYRSRSLDVRVGDHTFATTPLTDYVAYGAGAGVEISKGALRAGGHHAVDRRVSSRRTTSSAFIGLAARPLDLEARWLDRNTVQGGSLFVGRGRLNLGGALSVDGEFAVDPRHRARGYRVDLTGRLPGVTYRLSRLDADPALPVNGRGARQEGANLHLQPLSWFAAFGSVAHTSRSLDQSVGNLLFDDVFQWQTGATFLGRLTFDVSEWHRRTSWSNDTERAGFSRTLRARGSLRGSFWSLRPHIELAEGTPLLGGPPGRMQGAGFDLTLRAGRALTLSAAVDHRAGASIGPHYEGSGTRVRTRLSSALTSSTDLTLSWSENRREQALRGASRVFDFALRHRLPFGHRIEARIRSGPAAHQSPSNPFQEPAVLLSYVVPLSIPISRSSQWGQLRLRVGDQESGAPLPGVRVNVGGTFGLTDRRGEVLFGALTPGDHRLQLGGFTPGLARIVEDLEQLNVRIEAGEETVHEVHLVPGGILAGTVRRLRFRHGPRPGEAMPELVDAGPYTDIVVEAMRDGVTHRVSPDAAGRYAFLGLVPGEWEVRAVGRLPEWHVIEPEVTRVLLRSHERVVEDFRVVPVRRDIRMIKPGPNKVPQ